MQRAEQVAKLLSPDSVAVVGASRRPGWGLTTIENLDRIGFAGPVYPVNPRYQEVAGRQCFGSLRELPQRPDAVAIALPAAAVPAALEEAVGCGIPAAVVYASGFGVPGQGEGGNAGPDSTRARLTEMFQSKRIAVQGPNCLGMINYARRAALWGITMPLDHLDPGHGVALIAQSGNMALTLGRANRGARLTHLVSCGNQLDVTAAELMTAALADPTVRVLAVILESIPDLDRFRAVLIEAAERDVPVVALKIGKSERASRAAMAHTGSLSGPAALYRSFFRQFGVIQVEDLDELAAALAVLAAGRRPRGSGVAIFASSGGECGLAADVAELVGVVLPDLPAPMTEELRSLLPEYGHVANPLDLTAGGWGDAALYADVIEVLARAPGVHAVVGIGDAPTLPGGELRQAWQGIIRGLTAGAERVGSSGTVVAGLSSLADLHRDVPTALVAGGVVPLMGLRPGLSALAKAGWYAQWREKQANAAVGPDGAGLAGGSDPGVSGQRSGAAAVRRLLHGCHRGAVSEDLAKRILAHYDIDSPKRELASSPAAAVDAAARIGYPVVVKIAAADIQHKTEVGGVRLDLRSAEEVREAAEVLLDLGRRTDPAAAVLVERYVTGGLELIVGGRRDEKFGPIVLVGLGGIRTELTADVSHRLAPVTVAEAETMISELTGRGLLDGFRGGPGTDKFQLARIISAVARLLTEHEEVAELDINPLVADPASSSGGLIALDALLVLNPAARRVA